MDFRQGLRKAVASVLPIPPCESGPDNLVVQVPPIRQYDLGDGALIPVDVADLHGHHLPESQIPGELLCPRPEWLLHFRAVDPPQPDPLRRTVVHHADGVAVADSDNLAGEVLSVQRGSGDGGQEE